MYHAQTINGSRFAEMRLHDYCLGSLILFHDFLIIYWLTLYWQFFGTLMGPPYWDDLMITTTSTTIAHAAQAKFNPVYDMDAFKLSKLIGF